MAVGFRLETLGVDRNCGVNLDRQIYLALRDLIERRLLASGAALPSTRLLARDLGLGRNTVIAAYEQLALEGFLSLARGSPPVVKGLPLAPPPRPERPEGESALSRRGRVMSEQPFHHGAPGVTAFHPGLPDADNFPFNTWSKLVARRTKRARSDLFGSYHIMGYPPLCEAIARYLTASRGVVCQPEQVIITSGAQAAFDLMARLLTDPGETAWMEEPGYYGAGAAFLSAGARLAPLRVTDQGWDFTPPDGPSPRVIFVTPSCHHPLGLTMTMAQRLDLIGMAAERHAWIIEDDYDSEYRFQGQPIPALQGTAPHARVVFVGTFAKILFPAMRLGYMVVPLDVRDRLTAALNATGQFAPLITQAALADFINEGHLTRHLRRMRRLYAERRLAFMDAFDRQLAQWMELRRTDSGIQLVGLFNDQTRDDAAVAGAARSQGVNVSPLSLQYRFAPRLKGLLMGFAAADARATKRGIEKLAQAIVSA